eukprot:g15922.t1
MTDSRSLKRRRSWLEIGFAGCVMLANPVHGATWPSFGTVWSALRHTRSLPPHPTIQDAHRTASNGHGTQEQHTPPRSPCLRGSSSAATTASPRRARHALLGGGIKSTAAAAADATPSSGRRRVPPLPGRVLEVEIAVHGAFGDWEACSPDTCTQTRAVFCETRESRIVASDFCGDELPDAERPCLGDDIAAVCGDTPAAAAARSAAAAAGEGRDRYRDRDSAARGGSGSGSRPSVFPSAADGVSGAGRSKGEESGARGGDGASPASAGEAGDNDRNSTGRDQGGSKPASSVTREKEPASKASAPAAPPSKNEAADKIKIATSPRGVAGAGAQDAGGSKEDGEGSEEAAADGGGGETGSTKSVPSRKQGETHSNGNPSVAKPSPESTDHKPNLAAAANGGQLSQMGRVGPRSHRVEYRFWMVLAIGAGAVGSFMAVVVFAVGQYRKEQHRLRGIMALNEFPQDNYINPFAKQLPSDLSEDGRSAFKL